MQFRVLGPVEVLDDGEPLDIGTPRQRALLARLLVDANRVVPLDRIIDDLWEGEPPAAATATLQSYVSLLRRVLEPDRAPILFNPFDLYGLQGIHFVVLPDEAFGENIPLAAAALFMAAAGAKSHGPEGPWLDIRTPL